MFLKSASGAALSIPFLPSMLTAFSEKAMASTPSALRYVHMFSPHGGLAHKNWAGTNLPTTSFNLYANQTARMDSIATLAGAGDLSPVLTKAAFGNLWSSMNLILGNDQPYYVGHGRGQQYGVFALSNGVGSGVYDGPVFVDESQLTVETPGVDQILANYGSNNGIYGGSLAGRRRQLNCSTGANTAWGRLNYNSTDAIGAMPLQGGANVQGMFYYLFGGVSAGPSDPITNLINVFWPSGKALMQKLSSADRQSLDQLFQMASDVVANYVAPTFTVTAPANLSQPWDNSAAGTSYQLMADIIAMGFKADATRIVTVGLDVPVNGSGNDWHGYAHNTNGNDANQTALIAIYQNIATNFVARLASNLNVADPLQTSSTMLNNSLLYWAHEHKAPHSNNSTPTLLMGASGGRLKTGNLVDLRNLANPLSSYGRPYVDPTGDQLYSGDMINRLWATFFYAMNVPRSAYEINRAGSNMLVPLTSGYGHVFKSTMTGYDISRIGEPWEFLMQPGQSWG